jgi:hypothetical protein
MLRFLAVLGFACGLIGGQQALAFGGYGGGGWHGSGGGWHGGGGHWHGGGWGGWGYPLWGYGWASPYLYAYPYDYGYDYPPPPGPDGGLYCVTKAHLCALTSARAPGARCSCSGVHGRVSVLQGQ